MSVSIRPPPLVLMIHRPRGIEAYGGYLSTAGFRVAEARGGQHGFEQAIALLPDFTSSTST